MTSLEELNQQELEQIEVIKQRFNNLRAHLQNVCSHENRTPGSYAIEFYIEPVHFEICDDCGKGFDLED